MRHRKITNGEHRLVVFIPERTAKGLDHLINQGEANNLSDLVRNILRDHLKNEKVWDKVQVS